MAKAKEPRITFWAFEIHHQRPLEVQRQTRSLLGRQGAAGAKLAVDLVHVI
jgi:hypothetical protein